MGRSRNRYGGVRRETGNNQDKIRNDSLAPIRIDGTGNGNASEYYMLEHGAWKRIDAESWDKVLMTRIPKGVEVRTGVWPDVHAMTADAYLYRDGDYNCCPTAGHAHVKLGIQNRKFTIQSRQFVKDST